MIFRRAKWRLALSFASVQLVLFGAFAVSVYTYISSAFDVDIAEGDSSAETVEQAFATLRSGLFVGFVALVLIIPVTSYVLASLALRPIRSNYEAQQRFVDDASHELRTPLSAIQAQLELGLSRPRESTEYRTILGRSLAATSRLTGILDDLLIMSRGAHGITGMMREVDVAEIVDEALDQLAPGDVARVKRFDRMDGVVVGVPSMLSRAIVNLLTNAMRYSDASAEVRVEVTQRGATVRISVVDNGRGMTKVERRQALQRFWRADPARGADGRGLGLSIVDEIARIHGGRIDLLSEPGEGTRATLELPLSR
jgi:signal transduction histidine kinase